MQVEKDGIVYCIEQHEFEPNDVFFERMWFVVNQKPKNEEEYKIAVMNSNIWSNIHFLNCEYEPDIHNHIIDIKKSFHNS